MPKEVRYILFSRAEVQQALLEGMAAGDVIWQGAGDRFRLDLATAASGDPAARLVLRRPVAGQRSIWEIAAGDILAMLLRFCRHNRVPLPMRGHKRLELMGTCLCMTITIGDMQAEAEVVGQQAQELDPELETLAARR